MSADERFRTRGPYWRPGMSVLVEPWVALAESNAGHIAVVFGRSRDHAAVQVERWRMSMEVLGTIDERRVVVGAALVAPDGTVAQSWGEPPTPGGEPRWTALRQAREWTTCGRCEEVRWPGCWMAWSGCRKCLPDVETDDPRPAWPVEPSRPRDLVVDERPKTPARRKSTAASGVASPDGDRIF